MDLIVQNWMSVGKLAREVVLQIQKIDSDNYPEVIHGQHVTSLAFNGIKI